MLNIVGIIAPRYDGPTWTPARHCGPECVFADENEGNEGKTR
jgi:hypothetical protein